MILQTANPSTKSFQLRNRAKRWLIFVTLAIVVILAMTVHRWYSATSLKEAYLPSLESHAANNPTDGALLTVLSARYVEAKDYPDAEITLRKAVAAGATDGPVWLTWAACKAAQGQPSKAGAILKLGLNYRQAESDIRAALNRCRTIGQTASPAVLAQTLCPSGVTPLEAKYMAGSPLDPLFDWWGKRHPASSGYETRKKWSKSEPDNIAVQVLWVDALLTNRRFADAEAVALRIVSYAPQSAESHLALADVLYKGGATIKAGLQYKQCLTLRPHWLPAELGLGNVALDKRLILLAVNTFQQATSQYPNSTDAWIGLGRAYLNQRLSLDRSLDAFKTAVHLSPNRTDFFDYYSDALIANYLPDLAEAVLNSRLRADSSDARAHYLLGLSYLNNRPSPQRESMAESEFRKSLMLQPNVPGVEVHLAQILLDQNSAAEASELLRSSVEYEPRSYLAYSLLARADTLLGHTSEAKDEEKQSEMLSRYSQDVSTLEGFEERDPVNISYHKKLAILYTSGGENDKAYRESRIAFLLQSHSKEAMIGLKTLNAGTGSYEGVLRRQ